MGCSVKVTYGMLVDQGFHLLMKEARLCLSHWMRIPTPSLLPVQNEQGQTSQALGKVN